MNRFFREKYYKIHFFILLFFAFWVALIGDTLSEALLLSNYPTSIMSKIFAVNGTILFLFSISAFFIVDKLAPIKK